MFQPTELLAVARGLVDGSRPDAAARDTRAARVRTAYGRAYYALYLLVRSELEDRHGIPRRWLNHGAVYTKLQSSLAGSSLRQLGRELQRLYTLRQKADYELDPGAGWAMQLEDERGAGKMVALAADWAASLKEVDFSPVVSLFATYPLPTNVSYTAARVNKGHRDAGEGGWERSGSRRRWRRWNWGIRGGTSG